MIVPDLAIDIHQQDSVYALATVSHTVYVARKSGLYRSDDGGVTWVDTLTALPETYALIVTAVVGQGEMVFAGVKGGVLCSYDACQNWKIVGLASPPPDVMALALSPNYADDGVVMAGTADDGVFVSTDRGATWIAWNFGLIDAHVFTLAFSPAYKDDGTVFAGTESGLFVSKNGGRGWSEVDFPMTAAPVLCLALSPTFAVDGLLYAGTESSGLFSSDDSGKNWRQVENPLLSGAVNAILIRRHPAHEIWVLLEDKVLVSTDKGQSWQPSQVHIPSDKNPMTMTFHPTKPTTLILGFADGDMLLVG